MTSVLVVDDSALDSQVAGGLLEKRMEIAVMYANDGRDALKQFGRVRAGIEARGCSRRSWERWRGVPVTSSFTPDRSPHCDASLELNR